MGRVLMVTRSISSTKVKFRAANNKTETFDEHEIVLSGSYDDENKLYKALVSELKDTDIKYPKIVSFESSTELYGMTEKDFLASAVKLNPDTRKPMQDTEATNVAE